jgi:hypothetical protein
MEDLVVLISALATPQDTALLTQIEGSSQGSQEECQFVYVERLYGAQQPFEDIRTFYEQTLVADGWQKNVMFSDARGISFERADGFVLGVYDDETASHISRSQIESIQQEFTTVYLVSAVYAVPTTWKRCGQRVEGGR